MEKSAKQDMIEAAARVDAGTDIEWMLERRTAGATLRGPWLRAAVLLGFVDGLAVEVTRLPAAERALVASAFAEAAELIGPERDGDRELAEEEEAPPPPPPDWDSVKSG